MVKAADHLGADADQPFERPAAHVAAGEAYVADDAVGGQFAIVQVVVPGEAASKFGKYPLTGLLDLTAETHETAHGGYDPTYANQDADRVLPVDVMRDLVKEGVVGSLREFWYATVGNGTSVANAKAYAAKIAEDLRNYQVAAVILTST